MWNMNWCLMVSNRGEIVYGMGKYEMHLKYEISLSMIVCGIS